MPRFARTCLGVAAVLALGLGSRAARAQTAAPTATTTTTTPTGTAVPCTSAVTTPTVSVSLQLVPERFVNGVDLGLSTRPPSLNPNGISYQDCIDDMVLQFKVTACGFTGAQNLQIWASKSSDCTSSADRGLSGVAVCWPVSQGSTGLLQSQGGLNYNVRVRDIVGPQNDSPSPTTMTSRGAEACNAQATFLAVPININFLPLNSSGAYVGQAFSYAMSTDMVGPPAPAGVSIKDGDTLFLVNWTPNVDTDTAGYDVVIDPIPGQEPADGGPPSAMTELRCPADSGTSTSPDGAAGTDAAPGTDAVAMDADVTDAEVTDATLNDGAPDAADATTGGTRVLNDAGCYLINQAGSGSTSSGSGGMCSTIDSLLTGGTLVGSQSDAAVVAIPQEVDEAGDVIDSGVALGTGGIWIPPAGHIVNPNPTIGSTATGVTNSTYTVTGLKNGVTYNVVVAAVDNFGNVGPPSTQACDFPAPVNDFWKIYRQDGGQAGGGFCALEAVGAPAGSTVAFAGAGALVIAGIRWRRRQRR